MCELSCDWAPPSWAIFASSGWQQLRSKMQTRYSTSSWRRDGLPPCIAMPMLHQRGKKITWNDAFMMCLMMLYDDALRCFTMPKCCLLGGGTTHPNDVLAYGKGNESVLHGRCFSHRSELLLHPPQHAQEPRAKCCRATQLESQEIPTGPKQQMSAGSAGKLLWFWSSPFLSEASTADFSSRLGNWPRSGRGDWRCQHRFSGWMLKVVEGAEAGFCSVAECAEFFSQVSGVLKNMREREASTYGCV